EPEKHIRDAVLYRILKRFFINAADAMNEEQTQNLDPERLKTASTHWLRHSHGSHALDKGVNLTTVQKNLGHKSIGTTSLYLHAEELKRLEDMELFDRINAEQSP